MDKAINKSTNRMVDAFSVFKDSSYQNLDKGEWIAPKDFISNWDELEDKEIPIFYKRESEFKTRRGKLVQRAPHFSLYPNSPAQTIPKNPTHTILINWLFERMKNNDLEFRYSKGTKPHKYDNRIKLSELDVNWNDYEIEVTINNLNKLRADILVPFHHKHLFLGAGIIFEIQLSKQSRRITVERTIERALHGYSVVWLFEKDFEIEEDYMELRENIVDINSFVEQLHISKKTFIPSLKYEVEHQSRLLDEKIKESQFNVEILKYKKEDLFNELKEQVNEFFITKSREVGERFTETILKDIQENFFLKNEFKIREIIKKSIPDFIYENTINEIKDEILLSDRETIIRLAINEIKNNKFSTLSIWRNLIEDTPSCPYCKNDSSLKLVEKKNGDYAYVCEAKYEGCSKWISIPNDIRSEGDDGTI